MYLLPETAFTQLEQVHQALGAIAEMVAGPSGDRTASLTPEQLLGLLALISNPLGEAISHARWYPMHSSSQ